MPTSSTTTTRRGCRSSTPSKTNDPTRSCGTIWDPTSMFSALNVSRSSAPLLAHPALIRSRPKPTCAKAAMPRSSAADQIGSKSGWLIDRPTARLPSAALPRPRTGASGIMNARLPASRIRSISPERPVDVVEVDLGDRDEPVGVAVDHVHRPAIPGRLHLVDQIEATESARPDDRPDQKRRVEELDVDPPLVAPASRPAAPNRGSVSSAWSSGWRSSVISRWWRSPA